MTETASGNRVLSPLDARMKAETSPDGVLGRFASRGSNPYEGGALLNSTQRRPIRIRKLGNRWLTTCRCGFLWTTEHHRLALLFATSHTHERVA